MEIIVREAQLFEARLIADFQVKMANETENLKLKPAVVNKGVLAVFENPELGKYYVAVSDNEVIASLLTTYEWSDWRNGKVIWIQSVYVVPEFRKYGVFREMYNYVKNIVQTTEFRGIRLYVDKTNLVAQKAYGKVGMNGEHYQLFEWMK